MSLLQERSHSETTVLSWKIWVIHMAKLAVMRTQEKKETLRTARHLALEGEPAKAIKLLDSHLSRTDSKDVGLLMLKGNILEMVSRFAQAAEVYRHVLRVDSNCTLALIDLGDLYKDSRKLEYRRKALQYFERALSLVEAGRFHYDAEDEFVDACIGKADTLLALSRPMDALKCVVNGLQQYPTNLGLGEMLERAQKQYKTLRERKSRRRMRKGGKGPTVS